MRRFNLFLVAFFLFPSLVSASSVVRTGEAVTVAADQVVEGDFYGFGGTSAVSGEVTEDLLILGGTVTVNGTVGADMFVVGGTVDVHGTVNDDIRVVGGSVTVAGEVKGDVVVFASELKVLSTATIGGDILFFGGKAEISGSVGSDIMGTSESLRIDGPVAGKVDVTARTLTLGERAEITENVSYTSMQEIVRAQNATVHGRIIRTEPTLSEDNGYRAIAISFLVLLFAALVIHLLFRTFTQQVADRANERFFRTFTIGFATLFLVPIAASVLLISTLGSIVGIILLCFYFGVISLAIPLSCVVAGVYVMRFIKKPLVVSVLTVVTGTLVFALSLHIPFFGSIILISVVLLTMGALVEHGYRLMRN
jgi:cytoskeletal protein CcmA (bactofilin family)